MFLGASFWNTLAWFTVAAESGHFLFRLNVSAMDAYAFEVSLSLAFVLLLRVACVPPPNRSEDVFCTISRGDSVLEFVIITSIDSHRGPIVSLL